MNVRVSLVQSLGKNEMSVPWRANRSRVHGPSSENRGVSWAISWFFMEIGLRPRCSSTGKAHRVKKAHHFGIAIVVVVKSEIVFFINISSAFFGLVTSVHCLFKIVIENIYTIRWCSRTYCVYANDIIWSFGLWIENVASKMSSFFFYHSIYTYVFNTTLTLHSSPHTSLHMNCLSTTTLFKNSEKKQKAADM